MDSLTNLHTREHEEKTEEAIIFRRGLPGLGRNKKFSLYMIENNPLFYYLRSVDEPEVGLILIDPFPCFPEYSIELNEQDKKEIELERQEDVLVFTTVTVLGEGKLTTNLSAPVVVNAGRRLAKQVIIPERIGQMRTPLPFEAGEETAEETAEETGE
ncbi:MAG: flagellar assembly protein FliW [Bacillota bacterium]